MFLRLETSDLTANLNTTFGLHGSAGEYGRENSSVDKYIVILDNLEPPVHDGRWPKYVLNKGYTLIRGDVRKKNDLAKQAMADHILIDGAEFFFKMVMG